MKTIDDFSVILANDDSFQKLKDLSQKIENNAEIKTILLEVKKEQRNYVKNPSIENKKSYNNIKQEILDYPFLSEYLDLVEEYNDMFQNIFEIINYEIVKGL